MKHKIAVFTNGFSNEFIELVLTGLQKKAAVDGTDIFVFLTFCSQIDNDLQNKCQLNIFHLPNPDEFDGAIVLANTYNSLAEQERVCACFQRAGVPMLSLEVKIPDMSCIYSENYEGIRDLTIHLIEKHNAKTFMYVNGVAENVENLERKRALTETLAHYGRELNVELEGDFSYYNSYLRMKKYLDDGNKPTDAIVCANDLTALGICNCLHEHGYRVPEDVKVTGFDKINAGQYTSPILASVSRGWESFGEIAYDKLMYQIENPTVRFSEVYKSYFVPSESCGCEPSEESKEYKYNKIQNLYQDNLHSDMIEIFFQRLQLSLSRADSKEDFYNKGMKPNRELPIIGNNYCICTEPAFFEIEDDVYASRIRGYSPQMDVLYENKNGEKLPLRTFDSKELYPGYKHVKGESNTYIFAPLNHMDFIIGYVAIKNSPGIVYTQKLRSWIMSMNAVLFGMRQYIFAQKANRELKKIYMTDALTGLYNRTGCNQVLYEFIKDQKAAGKKSILAFADIDRMKTINDLQGHLNGDLAIKATADAFQKYAPSDWLFGRYGGDEFIAVGTCLNPDSIPLEIQAITNSMADYFESLNLTFTLHASIGYTVIEPDDEDQIEDYIQRADKSMYKEKEKIHKILDSTKLRKNK